jgi:aryl-alcohol dehydrogenase-like predicted oxidoreductase
MEYRRIGKTGLKVSELCLGCMTFGVGADEATSRKMVAKFTDQGGNFLDTANVYAAGQSEEITGRAIKDRRKSLILATKVRFNVGLFTGKPIPPNAIGLSRAHIMSEVEESLRRLGTDYIDLYQVHSWDFETPIEETMRALDDLVRSGKVRYVGSSNFNSWQMMKSLWASDKMGVGRFDCLQPQYSLICRDIEREILPLCRMEGVGVIPWSPLGGGFLTGKYRRETKPPEDARLTRLDMWNRLKNDSNYKVLEVVEQVAKERGRSVAEIALAWVNQQPGVSSVIIGARTMEQYDQNLKALGLKLEQAELDLLDKPSALAPEYPNSMQARLPGPRP